MSELTDLRERLEKAARTLDEAAPSYWEDVERCRIRGKAEGVRLALSYVEEALRMTTVDEVAYRVTLIESDEWSGQKSWTEDYGTYDEAEQRINTVNAANVSPVAPSYYVRAKKTIKAVSAHPGGDQ